MCIVNTGLSIFGRVANCFGAASIDDNAFYNPMTLAHNWMAKNLQFYQSQNKYCIDPERRPHNNALEPLEGRGSDKEDGPLKPFVRMIPIASVTC
jgi:hypothetical protein